MMFVAVFDRNPLIEPHPQARAEQRLLNVVRRQRIAGEELVDVAGPNEFAQVLAAAGVNDRRPADDERLASLAPIAKQLARDLADRRPFRFLGRHAAGHELEAVTFHIARLGQHSRSGMPTDDRIAENDVGHRHAARHGGLRVDDDAAVHFLQFDFAPLASQSDFGPLVRRTVEPFGKRSGDVGGDEATILQRRRHRAVVGDLRENFLQRLGGRCADLDERVARVVARLADGDLLDPKRAAAGRDQVENLRQNEAVDDVAVDFDVLDRFDGSGDLRLAVKCVVHDVLPSVGDAVAGRAVCRWAAAILGFPAFSGCSEIGGPFAARRKSLRRLDFTAVGEPPIILASTQPTWAVHNLRPVLYAEPRRSR